MQYLLIPLLLLATTLFAEDAPDAGPWSHEAKISLSGNAVSGHNAEDSRDTAIGDTTDTFTWRAGFDGKLVYEVPRHAWRQRLNMAYGRQRDDESGDRSWRERIDEILYDSQYDLKFKEIHSWYTAWGADSVFTGPEPDEDPFDPTLVRVSTGYSQHFKNLLPEEDELTWRVGVRAQRHFGGSLRSEDRVWASGIEGRIRYDRKQNELLDYFGQYEIFSEFEDLAHITHLLQAGINYKLNSLLSFSFNVRAYYESEPDDAAEDAIGYDEFSWRQETLFGLIYSF